MERHEALRRDAGARLLAWLEAVERVDPAAWTEPPAIPDHVRAESEQWCDRVLAPEANPHDVPGVRCAAHRGELDLLRHGLSAGGLDLTVFEGRNFLLVRVDRRSMDLLAVPPEERPAAVARAAGIVFREAPCFEHCEPIAEGVLFCSSACADPLAIAAWGARAEGGVRDGELWFAVYKKHGQRLGFANAAQWFDDTGEAVRRRARRAAQRSRRTP